MTNENECEKCKHYDTEEGNCGAEEEWKEWKNDSYCEIPEIVEVID